MNDSDISNRRHLIDKARRDKMSELMTEYDNTVYHPALKELRAACKEQGHGGIRYHDNGLGWTFEYCYSCGGIVRKHGPDGQIIED